ESVLQLGQLVGEVSSGSKNEKAVLDVWGELVAEVVRDDQVTPDRERACGVASRRFPAFRKLDRTAVAMVEDHELLCGRDVVDEFHSVLEAQALYLESRERRIVGEPVAVLRFARLVRPPRAHAVTREVDHDQVPRLAFPRQTSELANDVFAAR